jgi:tripartite-type tricarboxylate transporter receptor subunit TctC
MAAADARNYDCVDLTSAYPHIFTGNVIALGLVDARRSRLASQVPTIAEGGVAGFGREPGFIGIMAPARTPNAIIKKLSG